MWWAGWRRPGLPGALRRSFDVLGEVRTAIEEGVQLLTTLQPCAVGNSFIEAQSLNQGLITLRKWRRREAIFHSSRSEE